MGALIVDDDAATMPPEIAAMAEKARPPRTCWRVRYCASHIYVCVCVCARAREAGGDFAATADRRRAP